MLRTVLLSLVFVAAQLTAGAGELPFLKPTVDYSGTRVMDTAQGRIRQQLYWTPDKVRTETAFQGMTVTNIVRQDLGLMWIVNAGMSQCLEQSLDQVEADMGLAPGDALEARDVDYEELGQETIGGVETTRYRVVSKDTGEVHRAMFWVTSENIPLKMQVEPGGEDGDQAVTMTLEDLEIGPVDPALFESPGQCMRMPAMPQTGQP
jgi:hypothetical protein